MKRKIHKIWNWIRFGKITSETVPLGEGMVKFNKYFSLLKEYRVNVPASVHYEYPLGGAEHGATELTIKREDARFRYRKQTIVQTRRISPHLSDSDINIENILSFSDQW